MGKQDQRWVELIKNMDEHMRLLTVYRRKFRITEKSALTIIASINQAVATALGRPATGHH